MGWEQEEAEDGILKGIGKLLQVMIMSIVLIVVMVLQINIIKTHTLSMYCLLYINHTSIKLFLKTQIVNNYGHGFIYVTSWHEGIEYINPSPYTQGNRYTHVTH